MIETRVFRASDIGIGDRSHEDGALRYRPFQDYVLASQRASSTTDQDQWRPDASGPARTIVTLVKEGTAAISNALLCTQAYPGELVFTDGSQPFTIECKPDAEGRGLLLHMDVPTAIFAKLVSKTPPCQISSRDGPKLVFVENLFTDIYEADSLSDEAAACLVETCLQLISAHVDMPTHRPSLRKSSAASRAVDVLRFMEVNLVNPHINPGMVAERCGISIRYLSTILHLQGTSFGKLLWGSRLKKARDYLVNLDPRIHSISEIAYSLGFKSTCHFSRRFKRTYFLSPQAYRRSHSRFSQTIGSPVSGKPN